MRNNSVKKQAPPSRRRLKLLLYEKYIITCNFGWSSEGSGTRGLSAAGGAAVGADEASLLIDEGFLSAVGASLSAELGSVGHILFEGPLDAHLPSVDALVVEFERADELEHLLNGHTVAQHARDELGVVPELGVELLAQSLDGGFEASLVDELEVVALVAVLIDGFDDFALCDRLGTEDALFVVGDTGEDFVGSSVDESNECDPFLFVVLESHHVGVKLDGSLEDMSFGGDVGRLLLRFVLFLVVAERDEYASPRAVAIYGAPLASTAPSLYI